MKYFCITLLSISIVAAANLAYAQSSSSAESVANAFATIDELRAEVQSLKGAIETYQHSMSSLRDLVEKRVADQDERLRSIEDRLQIYDKQVTQAVSAVVPQTAAEVGLYQKGLNQVQGSNFLSAVATFQTLLKQYPKSDMAANSQYWIAECYFAMKDYHRAIKEFQNYLELYPRGDKIPTAVFKQGLGFLELGMKEESKPFFNKVIKSYPGSSEADKAREQLKWLKGEEDKLRQQSQAAGADSRPGVPLAPGLEDDLQKQTKKKVKDTQEGKYD